MSAALITYSERWHDGTFEYRHVVLPPELANLVPKNHLMTETEWRNLGIQQSLDWEHYILRPSEPHVVPFRRKLELLQDVELVEIIHF